MPDDWRLRTRGPRTFSDVTKHTRDAAFKAAVERHREIVAADEAMREGVSPLFNAAAAAGAFHRPRRRGFVPGSGCNPLDRDTWVDLDPYYEGQRQPSVLGSNSLLGLRCEEPRQPADAFRHLARTDDNPRPENES